MARITVGIPAYKTAYLAQAITSVLDQLFVDFELLISDDSPDGSVRQLVEGFDDPRIRLIEGPRKGLVANSVQLWDHASADLLKYLYDDDFLMPDCLAVMLGLIEARGGYSYAFCRRLIVNDAGDVLESPVTFSGDNPVQFDNAEIAGNLMHTLQNAIGEPTSLLIRRSAFGSARCLDSYMGLPIRHLIDIAFYMNAAGRGRCIGVPHHLAAFRMHPDQVSAGRGAPAYSAALFEWEIFLRGAAQAGVAPPEDVVGAAPRLELIYGMFERAYPELAAFRAGLPNLETAARAGRRDLLTDDFRAQVAAAGAAIDARSA